MTWTPTVAESERERYPYSPYETDLVRVRLSPECRTAGQRDPADTRRGWPLRRGRASGLVEEDGGRQCWATIRSGLNAGLLEPIAPDADR